MFLRRPRRRRRGAEARPADRRGVGQTVKGVVKADSPLFRQYRAVKEQHPDKLLFFRMGDFYELFYDDARQASALLGLTLTRRRTADADIPMAGVPVASCANHIARLARMGETVALCDQVAPAAAGSGLMERKVTQIVTPGTLVEAEFLEERQACVIMAVAPERGRAGYAWLDLARGELRAGEADAAALEALYARLAPAELLAPEGFVYEGRQSLALRQLPPWEFSATSRPRALRERFGVADLRGFGLEDVPLAAAAAAVLLDYAESVQCQALDHVWKIGRDRPEASIAMDAAARRSLEIAAPLVEGGPTLLGAVDRCKTGMGARLLARLLRDPPRDHGALRQRMAASQALAPNLAELRGWLEGRCDLERVATRVALGRARPAELAAVRSLLADLPALRDVLPAADAGFAAAIAADYAEPLELLAERLAAEPRPGAAVAPGCSERLDRLRAIQQDAAGLAAGIEEEERERGATGFKLGHSRAHGYFFECHRSKAAAMPPHFERIQATKNAERFVTPELRRLHAEAVGAQEEGAELEKQLYAALQADLAGHGRLLRALADALASLDVALNMALLAAERGWTWPRLRDEPGVVIEGGRHAVIEGAVEYFVDNDTPDARAELITGPNMGGKSTYMRQVALIVLLAHAGAPVPAQAAAVGPVDAIMTRIGASDDLAGGRSTFMIEMAEVASILRQAGPQTLVILDELGRGTSVADGLALAWAALRALLERNRALVLLAT
ncbi:MAG: DNA mismatch repair protein MutS, partial [Betaproteobacteria bacterium AqS2]|nr:DNA mismatch repair protein MutS [Betaproteobacteria bacterium AqS2]